MSDKLTMKEAEELAKAKGYDFRSAIGLLKWLFEGRVVRTINGEPPDRNGDARLDALDVDLDSLTDSEVARILGGWAAGELDGNWNARAADKLAIARLIALTGDVSGSASFDGSANIEIETDLNVTHVESADSAAYLSGERRSASSARLQSANGLHDNGKRLRALLATSAMATGKPPQDAHMLHFSWDNGTAGAGTNDAQLALAMNPPGLYIRTQIGGTWTDWIKIHDEYTGIARTPAVPYGAVDSTSTATAFTASVTGITALYDGVCAVVYNGAVASASGCTLNINSLGAKPIANPDGSLVTTGFEVNKAFGVAYSSTLVSGGCWILVRLNYTDTTYSYMYNLYLGAGDSMIADGDIKRYELLVFTDEGKLASLNSASSYSTGTSKTMKTSMDFNPFLGIRYYRNSTVISDGSRFGNGAVMWTWTAINARYTFNCGTTLTANAPLYLKMAKQSNGMFRISSDPCWAQTLPSTNDGYYYMFLGRTYSTYQLGLYPDHPIYYHDGTQIREYLDPRKAPEALTDAEVLEILEPSLTPRE